MFRFILIASLIFPFVCFASLDQANDETLSAEFQKMDVNKDGFLSESEFLSGIHIMRKKDDIASDQRINKAVSSGEKEKIITTAVTEAKKILPYKIDSATTWTDAYAKNDELHYTYRVEMDLAALPENQKQQVVKMLGAQICAQSVTSICAMANDTFFQNGIKLISHYTDQNGSEFSKCSFSAQNCVP